MISITQYAERHNMKRQRVHQLILQGRIKGAIREFVVGTNRAGVWMIPNHAKVSPINGALTRQKGNK